MLTRGSFEGPQCGITGNNPEGWQRENGWTEEGFEDRSSGIRNIRTLNFGLRSSRMPRASRIMGCGTGELFQHPASTMLVGPSERSNLTAKPFREYKNIRSLIPTGILMYEGISQSNLWNHGGCRFSDAPRDSAGPSEINCTSTSHP